MTNFEFNTIELTKELVQKFVHTDYPTDEMLPFDDFGILFKISDFTDKVQDKATFIAENAQFAKKKSHLDEAYELFQKEICTLIVHADEESVLLTLNGKTIGKLLTLKVGLDGFTIENSIGETTQEDKELAYYMIKVLHGTVYNFNHPNTVVKSTNVRERKSESKVTGYESKSKKYIYRVKYIIENPQDAPTKKRTMNRHTESWDVCGHPRHYKNGKVIWVKPYVKGKGAKTPKTYKLK